MNLRISKKKLLRRGLIVPLAAATLLLGTSTPASADVVAGSGAGVGYDYPTNVGTPPGPCFPNVTAIPVDANRYVFNNDGFYAGVRPSPASTPVYRGPSRVEVRVGPHFISPLGTHLACPAVTPDAIPIISATVSGSSGPGSISCPGPAAGTVRRAGQALVIDFTSSCTVTGNVVPGTATAVTTRHVLTSVGAPCEAPFTGIPNPACATPPPPPDPDNPPGAIYVGNYQALGLA